MASIPNQGNLSIGLNPLSYVGVRPTSPAQFYLLNRDPNENDKNYIIGTWILNKTNYNLWILVNLNQGVATWVLIGEGQGTVTSLTSNTGGQIDPDMGNINVVGDGITLTGAGNPATHTITFSTVGGSVVRTITGNSGGAVGPAVNGNLTLVGSGVITVVGNPGSNTLTITPSGSIASSFLTDNGSATPALGVITFNAVSQAGSSVRFSGATSVVRLNVTDASGNTLVGLSAGNPTLTGTFNTALGLNNLQSLTTGSRNTAIGSGSGALLTTGSSNTFIGPATGSLITTGTGNTLVGDALSSPLLQGIAGINGLYGFGASVGTGGTPSSLFFHNYGGNQSGNTFVGYNSGASLNAGQLEANVDNTGCGQSTLESITTGFSNSAFGYQAGRAITESEGCTIIGRDAGLSITTGTYDTLVGFGAGNLYAGAESGNIVLGCTDGTPGENNTMRLGNDGTHGTVTPTQRAFMSGVRGVATGVNDAIAVLIDSAGQLGTVSSSIRYKDNVVKMGYYSEDIYGLNPVVFNYKNHSPNQKSVGLIAEEVIDVMPDLVVRDSMGCPETVKYQDLVPLLLNEVIKLRNRIERLENER